MPTLNTITQDTSAAKEEAPPPDQTIHPAPDITVPKRENADDPAGGIVTWLRSLVKGKNENNLREAIEEYIEAQAENGDHSDSIAAHERMLISNVLKIRNLTVFDIMIPRAAIVGVEVEMSQEALFALLADQQYSRLPVYQETLDDVLGTIHIKDILSCIARGQPVVIRDLIREVPIIAPSLHVLDLLLQMRQTRKHLALVVDEFGGIDGLITIGDVLEAIIGQIEDEHDQIQQFELHVKDDGTVIADGRVYLEEFEKRFNVTLHEEDKEENDTLGGLVFSIAGRVPTRGEILTHNTGMIFEVLDADPRRVNRLKITNIPASSS